MNRQTILAAIDKLQATHKPVDGLEVARECGAGDRIVQRAISRTLHAMARDGIVVYDRKASGWRRV